MAAKKKAAKTKARAKTKAVAKKAAAKKKTVASKAAPKKKAPVKKAGKKDKGVTKTAVPAKAASKKLWAKPRRKRRKQNVSLLRLRSPLTPVRSLVLSLISRNGARNT